jgi:uncharacterized protein (TIGR02231 family)
MRIAVAVLVLAPVLAQAAPAQVKAASKIDAVTVYLSSARVTRTARAELPAGDVRLLLEGVSDQIDDDSVRAAGKGTAKAQISGVSVERVPHAEAPAEEVRSAQEKVTKLEDQDRALLDQLKQGTARREFLDGLRSTYVRERTENLAVRAVDIKEWTGLVDFIGKQYEAVLGDARKTEVTRRELGIQLQQARDELAKLQSKGSRFDKTVVVELRVEKAGSLDVELTYQVPNASWTPLWDARLDPEAESLDLQLYGQVRQYSGEDWNEVKLAASTAQPGRAIDVPELEARFLSKYIPRPPPMPGGRGRTAVQSSAPAARREMLAPAPMAAEAPLEEYEAEQAQAQVEQGLLAVTYTSPSRETVDGKGTPRKAFLGPFKLKAELTRIAAPSIDETVFLAAKATNETGVTLLAGAVNLFLGDEFVGKTGLAPEGNDVKLAFGPDGRIQVERKQIEKRRETAGIFAKDEVWRYGYRTTVKNHYPKAVTVLVLDQIPVSNDEDIKVALLDKSTKPTEKEEPAKPGVRSYRYTLQPKAEQAIELFYEVRFPPGTQVIGLD